MSNNIEKNSLKKRGLNRGLSHLLSSVPFEINEVKESALSRLPVEKIQPGKYQPRTHLSPEALQELADSIKAQGIIQPIVVRLINPQKYEIIAGERRWRAAQLAGLTEVPVVIREVPDEAAIAMALIENIQRENLNAIEEANALKRLIEEFAMTHQQIAESIGKSRVTVTNLLRLLELHPVVRNFVERGLLEQGHAKVLLGLALNQQEKAAEIVIHKNLSVRETEKLIHQWQQQSNITSKKKTSDANITHLEQKLSDQLGTPVNIQHSKKGKGKIIIHYKNLDILDGILERLK